LLGVRAQGEGEAASRGPARSIALPEPARRAARGGIAAGRPVVPVARLFGHRLLGLAARHRHHRRRLDTQFDIAQHRGDMLAQIGQHRLEQFEGLALVFVQRIALAIGAQIDPPPQA